jgi:hypothetical protein
MSRANTYRVDPLYVKMTTPRDMGGSSLPSVQQMFGNLSLTSQFKVNMFLGAATDAKGEDQDLVSYLKACGITNSSSKTFTYDFMCAEAVLPGATFDVGEESGSRQGIIERFPNRRVYSDFNLTFYVDNEYNIIRLFEEWMNFINPIYRTSTNGSSIRQPASPRGQVGFEDANNYFRFKYPNQYKRIISITKFERDFLLNPNDPDSPTNNQNLLTYQFIDAFPTNITALPLSYEGSTITKTTINFSYTRYTTLKHIGVEITPNTSSSTNPANPDQPKSTTNPNPYYGPAFNGDPYTINQNIPGAFSSDTTEADELYTAQSKRLTNFAGQPLF